MKEFQYFRQKLLSWMGGIAAVSSAVGSRITFGWPTTAPTYPLVAIGYSRRKQSDYPVGSWAGDVIVTLVGQDLNALDTIEDALFEDLGDGAVPAQLSTAGKVRVLTFDEPADIPPDVQLFHPETGGYIRTERTLSFPYALVALSEG